MQQQLRHAVALSQADELNRRLRSELAACGQQLSKVQSMIQVKHVSGDGGSTGPAGAAEPPKGGDSRGTGRNAGPADAGGNPGGQERRPCGCWRGLK